MVEGVANTRPTEDLWNDLGFEREEQDEAYDGLRVSVGEAICKYNRYHEIKELQALMDNLNLK